MDSVNCGITALARFRVWKQVRDAAGQLMRDGAGRPVLGALVSDREKHNAVSNTMLYYAAYYTGNVTTPTPVNYIRFGYNSSASSADAATTIIATANYSTQWQGIWANETGSTQTVDTVSLINLNSAGTAVVFSTATPAQAVLDDEVMTVDWTVAYTLNGSDEGTSNTLLSLTRGYFAGTTTLTDAPARITLADTVGGAGETYSRSVPLTRSAGGDLATASVTLSFSAENLGSVDMTIDTATAYFGTLDTAAFTKTGLTQSWPAKNTVSGTLVFTWAVT